MKSIEILKDYEVTILDGDIRLEIKCVAKDKIDAAIKAEDEFMSKYKRKPNIGAELAVFKVIYNPSSELREVLKDDIVAEGDDCILLLEGIFKKGFGKI